MELTFTKMNGAGNDFVICDNRNLSFTLDTVQISKLCDRNRGVGADGLLLVEPAQNGADFRMRYYNADGSEAEMCGNGARCFARFSSHLLNQPKEQITFETQAGVIGARLIGDFVQITMSEPHSHQTMQKLAVNGRGLEVHFINTGVPHAVVFTDDFHTINVQKDGSALRHHEAFAPKGTNANFVQVLSPGMLAIHTYERGVEAETLACGTGVCAAALIHNLVDNVAAPIFVRVEGGDTLEVGFERNPDGHFHNVTLTGPADFVFDGKIRLV